MRLVIWVIIIFLAIIALVYPLLAAPWKIDATANLGTVINAYSDSWVGGNSGSFNWSTQFIGIAEKQLSDHFNTQTTLKLQFGQTEIQDKTTKNWSLPAKSSDLIDALELLRLKYGWWADPFASVRLISQFKDGSDTLLTRYINPIQITEAIGASKTLRKTPTLTWTTRGGIALQQFVNRDQLDAVTGLRHTVSTNDAGVEVDMNVNAANAKKWASLLSDLRVYEAIFSSANEKNTGPSANDAWRYPRVNWETTGNLTFAKYLMLNLSLFLVYNTLQTKALQVQETFSAGITYTYSKK